MSKQGKHWPWLALALLWGMAFCVSCRLSTVAGAPVARDTGRSVAAALFGGSRTALSSHFFKIADLYFHKGAEHIANRAFSDDVFQSLLGEISPSHHAHIATHNIAEIMPWLRFATRTDPHNVDAYLVGAFWMCHEAKRPKLALEILREARNNNPRNYEIRLDLARILLRAGEIESAERTFDAALALWPSDKDAGNDDARRDRSMLLAYRALLHEARGEIPRAVAAYREILGMFPRRTHLNERIAKLQNSAQPSVLASDAWTAMLREDDKTRNVCPRDEHEEHEH